jgi:alkaline phosphatase D
MSDEIKNPKPLPGSPITRREALQLTLAAGISATAITLAVTDPAVAAAAGVFLHGVASGDPGAHRVVIWTRITKPGMDASIPVTWKVSEDRQMKKIVQHGKSSARATRDYTVKVDVDGLRLGRIYYYRFEVDGQLSPIGRTRTLPADGVTQLKFAVFSCSNYELGYFNAYAEAAKQTDLDAVLHLGDYIYEYGPGPGGFTTPAAALGLVPKPRDAKLQPPEEIILLDQYRARHALYRTDAHLQTLHRDNPFINIWDDHEVANDSWTGGAENHDPATEGNWQARKKAGIRAFYEWLPIREPKDGAPIDPMTHNPDDLYRVFDFGDLARLVMIDTRAAGRDEQFDTAHLVGAYAGAPPKGPFPNDVKSGGVKRTLMGKAQANWFGKQIADSTQTWQLIGNQVLMFYQNAPDINGTPVLNAGRKATAIGILDQLFGAGSGAQIAGLGAAGLPFPLAADAWTGYPTARMTMLNALAKAKNPIVLTGDSHNAWTANLVLPSDTGSTPVAAEFGGTSVSSPGFEQYLLGLQPPLVAALLVDSSKRKSPTDKLIYAESSRRGFMLVEVTPNVVNVDYVFLSTVFTQNYTTQTQSFRARAGRRRKSYPDARRPRGESQELPDAVAFAYGRR